MGETLKLCAGDASMISVPGVAKPIPCHSKKLASRLVECHNALSGLDPSAVAKMREALEAVAEIGACSLTPGQSYSLAKRAKEALSALKGGE